MILAPPPQPGQAPVLAQQPDSRGQLAALMAPRAPSAPLIDPAKIASFMSMKRDAASAAPSPTAATPENGQVMDQRAPFGALVNGLGAREGLFGSNGWLQRQMQPTLSADPNPATGIMTPTGYTGG